MAHSLVVDGDTKYDLTGMQHSSLNDWLQSEALLGEPVAVLALDPAKMDRLRHLEGKLAEARGAKDANSTAILQGLVDKIKAEARGEPPPDVPKGGNVSGQRSKKHQILCDKWLLHRGEPVIANGRPAVLVGVNRGVSLGTLAVKYGPDEYADVPAENVSIPASAGADRNAEVETQPAARAAEPEITATPAAVVLASSEGVALVDVLGTLGLPRTRKVNKFDVQKYLAMMRAPSAGPQVQ